MSDCSSELAAVEAAKEAQVKATQENIVKSQSAAPVVRPPEKPSSGLSSMLSWAWGKKDNAQPAIDKENPPGRKGSDKPEQAR